MNAVREPVGRVTIAPQVLITIVRQTTLENEGVERLAARSPRRTGRRGRRAVGPGVEVIVDKEGVRVTVHVIADPGVNMMRLAETLQTAIARAIEHMTGLKVSDVNVYIDDVSHPTTNSRRA
ncbi:MAG: Asp23/Gls24 family envelope stress response protein [Chloroflexi bacterium]|nr:Asp23/Gls24 family envelope stress response protein [Chloroflexota bacterium]